MRRPYVRRHVFLAGWGSFEASNFRRKIKFYVYTGISGVKSENFCKGRILADLKDIWKVFGENHSLTKIQGKKQDKPKKNQEKQRTNF